MHGRSRRLLKACTTFMVHGANVYIRVNDIPRKMLVSSPWLSVIRCPEYECHVTAMGRYIASALRSWRVDNAYVPELICGLVKFVVP